MTTKDQRESETHVLIFPFPVQGHVNSMLQLAELLALSDVHVTFLNTDHNHNRLHHFAGIIGARYPTLHFSTFSNGLPDDHPLDIVFFDSVKSHGNLKLRELCSEHPEKPRFSCIIADIIFSDITSDIGDDFGISIIHFHTASACSFWSFFSAPMLLRCNELPIRGEEDMDRVIKEIPGMKNLVRCRDLPGPFRGDGSGSHVHLETLAFLMHQTLRAQALILNTFEELEGPVISEMRLRLPKIYTLGPLYAQLNYRKASKTSSLLPPPSSFTSSLLEEDRTCLRWLDAQPPKSVIYVSVGSMAVITRGQLMEIWYGLVNSKKRFLLVIRPDLVAEQDGEDLPLELVEGTKERGYTVGWAPQKEVLEHAAVGGFMTHGGWNSTLESVVAGVPMICWPCFGDQQINSRFVSEAWKMGLDMKDVCERKVVEKMVNELMVERREEFEKTTGAMAALAKATVSQSGSSYSEFDRFIDHLKQGSALL